MGLGCPMQALAPLDEGSHRLFPPLGEKAVCGEKQCTKALANQV